MPDAKFTTTNHSFEPFVPSSNGFRNLTGQRFGALVIYSIYGRTRHRVVLWLCRCDCGTFHVTNTHSLQGGRCQSCGCFQKAWTKDRFTKHGDSFAAEYAAYNGAKDRCVNSRNRRYASYGGRGIEFRFESYDQFLNEIGQRPSSEYSLDRINNEGHYEPGNVRWATHKEQSRNMQSTRLIRINEIELCVTDWCDLFGISETTVRYRLNRGWRPMDALTYPFKWKGLGWPPPKMVDSLSH